MSATTLRNPPFPGARLGKSRILGPNGQPLSTWLYPSPRWNLRQYKPRYWLSADTKSNVTEYDRWELVNYSRQLFAQVGNLNTAVRQKASWAFGDAWDPHYYGENEKWGQEVSDWLKNAWFPTCNVRGPQYSFKRSLELTSKSLDVDGDDLMILTETESHWPQIGFFPSTRVGMTGAGLHGGLDQNKSGAVGVVSGGPFDGARIFDGVIMDRNSRPIGYRVVNEDGTWSDISSFNADLLYEPDWCDQGRGIPRTATCLLKFLNRQDIDEFLQRGVKRAASIGLIQKTEEGEGGIGNEIVTSDELPAGHADAGGRQIHYEEIEGGEMYYLSSAGNESLEALTYKNPHPNVEALIERIERESLASVGWFYELLVLEKGGRAPSRLCCDLANQSIWSRQKAVYKRAKRALVYAVSKGMKHGLIPPNYNGIDPYLWEFGLPKPLSVDAGNDAQADREALKMGITTRAIVCQKLGYHESEIRLGRKSEVKRTIQDALDIVGEFPQASGLTFDRVMELLEQRSPNPVMQQPRPQQQPQSKPTEK